MATRRTDAYAFDHGAQYFTVRNEQFRRRAEDWTFHGIVRIWEGRIRVVRGGELGKEKGGQVRYVGVPGMSAVTRHMAGALDIRWHTRVAQVRRDRSAVVPMDEDSSPLGSYDAAVVAIPPGQCAQVLSEVPALSAKAAALRMNPCWAVLLAFGRPLNMPFDGAFIHDSPLTWAALDSSKPGRGTEECWVLHADSAWTTAHLELDPEEIVRRLTEAFFAAVGCQVVQPVFAASHLWRYARAQNALKEGCLWDSQTRIGACGDWCSGSRIEGAFLSGSAMAHRVLAAFGRCNGE